MLCSTSLVHCSQVIHPISSSPCSLLPMLPNTANAAALDARSFVACTAIPIRKSTTRF